MKSVRKRSISAISLRPSILLAARPPPQCPRSHRHLSSSTPRPISGAFNRSDFGSQPFTGIYDPSTPTAGPLGGTSNVGEPAITPKMLKEHLDQFVIGQDRAKKVLSTAVYNHYQRIREFQRQEEEADMKQAQKERREMGLGGTTVKQGANPDSQNRHPLEDEFPGQQAITNPNGPPQQQQQQSLPTPPQASSIVSPGSRLHEDKDSDSLSLEKSNILLLGPSGSGKTLLARTLARILDVPFSMSDCTPLTQAGYIGEDVETVVSRLLAAANYDVARAEVGIICLDEIDKIASTRVATGKDVGGEGVQQALLKIVEGTTVTVQAKAEKTSPSTSRERERYSGHPSTYQGGPNQFGGGNQPGSGGGGGGKGEVYSVRTDNILFICTGAFVGLHKLVLDRIARGSMGFGAPIRSTPVVDSTANYDTTIKVTDANREQLREHLPYWHTSTPTASTPYNHSNTAPTARNTSQVEEAKQRESVLNTLDLITPADLHKYGIIPELIGRIPINCSLSPLTLSDLVHILTQPRNALVKQYTALLALSNIELAFTTSALHAIAQRAVNLGTGARGLRSILEGVLSEAMFEAPGSGVRFVLVNKDVVDGKTGCVMLSRGQGNLFRSLVDEEEDRWAAEQGGSAAKEDVENNETFEEYRKKASVAGYS